MKNVFKESQKHCEFSWDALGNIAEGRSFLGSDMPVMVYRLMQFTMLDVLCKKFGEKTAYDLFRQAGYLAGKEFARNVLDLEKDFNGFFANLQQTMKDMKIGILRMEKYDAMTGEAVLTVVEDLDCSGLPVTDETICTYDEGFIAGILEVYTGKAYHVREVDCWASGDRVCRFQASIAAGLS